jgi:hypothetical protein
LSVTPEILRRLDSAVEEHSVVVGDKEAAAVMLVEDVERSKELAKVEESSEAHMAMTTEADEVEELEVGDLAGRITISHSATAMPQLISKQIGRCWRKLISIDWPS